MEAGVIREENEEENEREEVTLLPETRRAPRAKLEDALNCRSPRSSPVALEITALDKGSSPQLEGWRVPCSLALSSKRPVARQQHSAQLPAG